MEKPSTSRIDLTGFQIGDFLIEKYIAEGGMATIYLATQLNLKRKVALKILKSKLSRSPKMLARFNREVETLSSLSHPNIVSIFGKGKAKINNNEHYFFAMEYVSGCNLRYAISQEKLNEIASYRIVLEILEALECAHEKGIIHRDIKPENILLTPQNHIKITDFGIAHLISHEDKVNLTEENVGIGTRSYMAPEQGLDSRSVDARADIYSVGVLLYELLTGVIPHGVFEPASTLNPQLEYPIDPIIFKAMASDREKRYPAAKQMHQEIQDFLKTGYLEIQRKNASPPLPPLRSSPFLSVPLLLILSLPLLLALSFFNPFKLLPPSLELTTLLKHFSKHTPLPENPNPSKTSDSVDPTTTKPPDSVDPTTTKPPDSVDPTTTKPLDPVLEKTVFLSEAQKFLWIANALIQKRSYESAKLYLEWARREVVLREEVEAQLKRIEREKKEEETCLSLQKHAQILMRVGKIQEALPYLEDMERVRPSLESHILVDRAYLVEKTALASYQEFLKNIFWYMSQARWNQAQEELHRFRETFSELRCLKALQTYLTQMQHQTEKMIVVKGGTFLRGPEPSQKVFVSVFFIDPYETSQGEYALF
jgi:serine/threonine protein kinase